VAEPDLLQAFLDDLVANPNDPELWLILADWLDERGDPRAELVRLSWSLLHDKSRGFSQRQARVQELLAGGLLPVVPRRTLAPDFEFAWCPPGSFLMGSPPSEPRRSRDEHRHTVTLSRGFWMGVCPVTQGQWRTVMGDNPSAFSRANRPERIEEVSDADLERFPVEKVSWNAAVDFCGRLGRSVGQPIRLPTEAEWEYACRAGTTTAFSFGDDPKLHDDYAVFSETGNPKDTRPDVVGRRKPNAFGLYDVHGNVCEFVQECHNDYRKHATVDPRGPSEGPGRVVRGGTFHFVWWHCRSAARVGRGDSATSDTGFRVCFTPG
jgi:uncharacterized protein (TIGR02996 family)